MGAIRGSTGRTPEPSDSAHSRQPSPCTTQSPSASDGFLETTTRPTAPPGHRLTERERRDVRAHVVHARAHVRVDREVRVPDESLPLGGLGDSDLGDLEEILVGEARGTCDEPDLA